jgi:heat shock protein HslJ
MPRHRAWFGVVVALVALVAAACSGGNGSSSPTTTATSTGAAGLTAVNWVLTDQVSLGVPQRGVTVTAQFDDGNRLAGDSGCNSYGASYRTKGSALTITDVLSTQRACLPADSTAPSPSAVEQAYLAKLPQVASFRVARSKLTLFASGGTAILVYRASDAARDLQGEWNATGYYTGDAIQSVITGTTVTARFDQGQVSGDGGCNRFSGQFEISGDSISIGPLATTLMACSDPAASTQESQYLEALQLATTFRVTGDRLELFRPGGTIAATFERAAK